MSTSQPNPHHDGNKPLKFEHDGNKRMQIKPNELRIIWGKDDRYWNVPKDGEQGPAELYQVSWLEVTGCVSATLPGKEYEVGFNISLTPDAFGWSASPVYILVKRGKKGKFIGQKFILDVLLKEKDNADIKVTATIQNDGGTVNNNNNNNNNTSDEISKLYFGLYEVWRGKWKGGLKIHHAFIKEI